MRRIVSKFEEEKKSKRNQFIIGGILMFIMIISTLGYAFQSQLFDNTGSSVQSIIYNGINFTSQNGFWTANYAGQQLIFANLPTQIPESDLSNLTKRLSDFSNKSLYIYSEDSGSESEIRINLAPFAKDINNACPEGIQCNQDFPVKNCDDNFIIILAGNESVSQEKNCIFIYGQTDNLINTVDNVLFRILGIR
ncbi:MAG TPA: hypothetical protein VMC07_02585 [Candidatus Omnitrophota bacterium]|nr:hypothetical protein [Candidatus Omnitrophota bacterium]